MRLCPTIACLAALLPGAASAQSLAAETAVTSGAQSARGNSELTTSASGAASAEWVIHRVAPGGAKDGWFSALSELPVCERAVRGAAELQASVFGRTGDDGDTDAVLDESAVVEAYGWRAEQWLGYQRRVSFASPFWRSGRNLLEIGTGVEAPPLWGIGAGSSGFWAFRGRVGYAELASRSGGEWVDASFDLDVDIWGFGGVTRAVDVRGFRFHVRDFGTVLEREGEIARGVGISTFDFHLLDLDWRVRDGIVVSAYGGLALRSPVGPFTATGQNSVHHMSEPVVYPDAWLEIEWRPRGDGGAHLVAGGGSHSRIDPTGYGADVGLRGSLSVRWPASDALQLAAELDIARLERAMVSMAAPEGIEPEGTRLHFARAAATAQYAIVPRWSLSAGAWAERSDRDDPRWSAAQSLGLVTRVGVDVSATARFGR